MATKKELKARITSLEAQLVSAAEAVEHAWDDVQRLKLDAEVHRTTVLILKDLWTQQGRKEGRKQVLSEIYGDNAPGRDVYEAHKLHLNSIYGVAAFKGGYTHRTGTTDA